jgi:predicted acylesterase/phospholipase RssA
MRHFVIGGGGPRAIVTGVGSILALRCLGLKRFSTIGGISGGSLPALFAADHADLGRLVEKLVALDFSTLLQRSESGFDPLQSFAPAEQGEDLPRHKLILRLLGKGALRTDRLGELIDEHVRVWPEQFWTLAMSENSHVLFTSAGVYEYGFDGTVTELSDQPAPLSLAIRATCAIPGILKAVEYRGRYLFDGSLSGFGACPVTWVRRHFMAEGHTVIRCFASGKDGKHNGFLWRVGRRLICHDATAVAADANSPAEVNIEPSVPQIRPYNFKLSLEQKQLGILAGFNATIEELSRRAGLFQEGLIPQDCCTSFEQLTELASAHTRQGLRLPGQLAWT